MKTNNFEGRALLFGHFGLDATNCDTKVLSGLRPHPLPSFTSPLLSPGFFSRFVSRTPEQRRARPAKVAAACNLMSFKEISIGITATF